MWFAARVNEKGLSQKNQTTCASAAAPFDTIVRRYVDQPVIS